MKVTPGLRLGALAALLGLTLAACGDDTTAPTAPFDAEAAEAATAAMQEMTAAAGDMSDAWGSLFLASGLFESTATFDLLPARDGRLALDGAGARRLVGRTGAEAFFPSNYLGSTFVWSAAEGTYVQGDATGAPADGIRIVYYAVDPFTGVPAEPLTALGYVDLRDLSSASSDRLAIAVVRTAGESDVTLADYYIDVSSTAGTNSGTVLLESAGYLSNGTDRLDFELNQDMTVSETTLTIDQDFQVSLAGTDLSVRYQTDAATDWEGQDVALGLIITIRNGGDEAVLDLELEGEVLAGVVRHNGSVVARITEVDGVPSFTDANGNALTSEQVAALEDLFSSSQGLLELAAGIFGSLGAGAEM